MSLSRFFSKPRWQSKDESIRRAAVATETDAELLAALPRLAREDPDAGVRIAVLKRLADPGLTQALAHDDRDVGVRAVAKSLWNDLLTGTHPSAPTLVERIRLLRAQDDTKLIEHIATRAPEAELRQAALARVTRPALIVERATQDADAGVREAALARIDDETQLVRIAERARKSDKKTSRLASERLDALRLARGDISTVTARARLLCEQLEAIVRGGDDREAITIDAQWQPLQSHVPADLTTRYKAARSLYEFSRDPVRVAATRERVLERGRLTTELGQLERDVASPAALAERESLVARFDALADRFALHAESGEAQPNEIDSQRVRSIATRLDQIAEHAEEIASRPVIDTRAADAARERREAERAARDGDRSKRQEAIQARIAELATLVETVEKAIESGSTASAHASWPSILDHRKAIGEALPAELRSRVLDIESRYAQLSDWQRWSDNHRRRQLCEELETLPAAQLHPDAVATRVREAQAEWTRLDALEGRDAGAADGLTRRFRSLCRQAIEPTRPYFDKRDELRKGHAQRIADLVTRAELALAEGQDANALAAQRRDIAAALRDLDQVDPRQRKSLAEHLKKTIGTLDARVTEVHAAVEAAKSALIAQAIALVEQTDVRSSIASARDLQKRWQASGNGKRSRDEAQWRAFRKAVDGVFARADDERAARTSRDRELLEQAAALCAELEELARAEAPPARTDVSRIDSAYMALGVTDTALRQRHQDAHAVLRDRQTQRQRNERRGRFDDWLAHHRVLRRVELGKIDRDSARAEVAALASLRIAAEPMQARLKSDAALRETAGETEAHRDCVIELEQLAGIESPAEDRQRRLDLQVAQLSARMRGDNAMAPLERLEQLLVRWSEAGALPASSEQLDVRLERAVERILGDLG